jgi:purine-binding chemotaxis protein CheW
MTELARAVPTTGRTDALLCRVHDVVCAVPLVHVVEIMRPLPVEPLGGAPPFVVGLARIRGAAVPVVDLGRLVAGHEGTASTRFVSVRSDGRVVALQVDAVLGVSPLPERVVELPPLLREDGGPVAALGERDRALLLVLATARLVPPDMVLPTGGLA